MPAAFAATEHLTYNNGQLISKDKQEEVDEELFLIGAAAGLVFSYFINKRYAGSFARSVAKIKVRKYKS